jgi:hypothetical protein
VILRPDKTVLLHASARWAILAKALRAPLGGRFLLLVHARPEALRAPLGQQHRPHSLRGSRRIEPAWRAKMKSDYVY